MQTNTTLTQDSALSLLIEKTAEGFFDHVRPSILMIGEWDDYFSIIKSQYKWAKHRLSVPGRIDRETTLILTNYGHYYEHILSLVRNMNLDTAILVYDESHTIDIKQNTKINNLICYLATVSPRYINGHIRSLLQLKRWYFGRHNECPLVMSDPDTLQILCDALQSLDYGLPVNVIGNDPYYINLVFKQLASNTHYDALIYVEHPDHFDEIVSHKYTTLILNVTNDEDLLEYEKKPLLEYSVIFISNKKLTSDRMGRVYTLNKADKNINDYRLLAYLCSLQQNLSDTSQRTRFIQSGDINTLYEKSESYLDFYHRIMSAYQQGSLKFRNIAPVIHGVSYGNNPLNELIDELTSKIYHEFFKQTNHVLEHAEMVSGISRSTLQPILGKIRENENSS